MRRSQRVLFVVACVSVGLAAACSWDPSKPFEREAPAVRQAIRELGDGGDAAAASRILEDYLTTGACAEGNIGTPEFLRKRPNGGFDLGLSLFAIAEGYGGRFGEEESAKENEATAALRAGEIACALKIVRAIAADETVPLETRVRARYLEGNLLFLDRKYKEAVLAYDKALELAPGMADAGDPVGRDAAWNRAIALRREEQKDAGQDASQDSSSDSPSDSAKQDSGDDGGKDDKKDGGDDGGKDDKKDGGKNDDKKDAGQDGGSPPKDKDKEDGGGKEPPPPPKQNQDDRMLDQLENAPTVQQEAAKKQAQKHKVRGTADK